MWSRKRARNAGGEGQQEWCGGMGEVKAHRTASFSCCLLWMQQLWPFFLHVPGHTPFSLPPPHLSLPLHCPPTGNKDIFLWLNDAFDSISRLSICINICIFIVISTSSNCCICHIHIHIHILVHTCIHTSLHAYIRTYIHAFTHIHLHTYRLLTLFLYVWFGVHECCLGINPVSWRSHLPIICPSSR